MIEDIILTRLVYDEEYTRKVIAFLKDEYFSDPVHKSVYSVIDGYIKKYSSCPTPESLKIEVGTLEGLTEKMYYDTIEYVAKMEVDTDTDKQWLLDKTEEFCQERAVTNAIMASIGIIDGSDKNQTKGAIPKLLQDALAVSFDSSVGHDYLEDFEDRYEAYHRKEDKIPFDLHYLNVITKGGISRKTLTVILAGTGVGKSMAMCHMAAANLVKGKNVLYITLEMSEEKVSERIDINLMDVSTDDLAMMNRDMFSKRVKEIKDRTIGRLIIKEYPTVTAGSATFRALLSELKIKKRFVPDIIYVDYLNICVSSRIKMSANVNSYTYVKAIAEELRGLAAEFNVPVVTATQVNRTGYSSSDLGLEDTSESFGLPMTADLMFALIQDEEMAEMNQILVKQLKNRYDDIGKFRRFIIGVDKSRQKLYDTEQSAQDNLLDGPVFDNSETGSRLSGENLKDKFKDLF